MTTLEQRNKELMLEAFERSPLSGNTEASDYDPYLPACVFHGAAEMFRGSTPDRDYMRAFPDLRLTMEDIVAEGDRVVTHLTGHGTHRGEFRGVPPSGERVDLRVIVISRIEERRIVEEWGTLSWE